MRQGTGKINWLAHGSRPDMSYMVAELSTHFKQGTVQHLKNINKAIKSVKSEPLALKFPVLDGDLKLVSFCDAALNNMDDGVSSAGGYIVFLVDQNFRSAPIYWTSCKLKRVVKSSLAAEALCAVSCLDTTVYLQHLAAELLGVPMDRLTPTIITDSKNLTEALMSPHPVQEKRLRVDLASIKQDVSEGRIKVLHCPGSKQLADALSKRTADLETIRQVIRRGSLKNI